MKKTIKIISLLTSSLFAFATFFGCGGNSQSNVNDNCPDYSKSDKEFTIWSYGATCDDWYQINGKRYYFEQGSLQTADNTQLYKDGGYNLLFVDYTFQESVVKADGTINPNYDFNSGDLKKVMDIAYEKGLKCFVFQPELHGLSNSEESRINPEKAANPDNYGKFFASQEDLNEYVAKLLAGLKDHPAFYGVSLVDEPKYTKFDAIYETYTAVKSVCPDAYVMMNILPYAENSNEHKVLYCGSVDVSSTDAYAQYLETYYEKVGQYCGFVQYDDYPILTDGDLLSTFLYNNRVISEFCKDKGLERRMVFQTSKYSNRRAVKAADMYWQLNIGMAMGTKEFSYYTYYPTVNSTHAPDETAYIVNRLGVPNDLYYTLKDFHKEMQFNAKALMNFEYQGMQHLDITPIPGGMAYISGLVNDEFKKLKGFTAEMKVQSGGLVLVTELYDKENDRYGYYVVNATNPAYTSEAVVTLDFGSYSAAQIYQFSKTENVRTVGGKVTVYLGTGGGAFIMPY